MKNCKNKSCILPGSKDIRLHSRFLNKQFYLERIGFSINNYTSSLFVPTSIFIIPQIFSGLVFY